MALPGGTSAIIPLATLRSMKHNLVPLSGEGWLFFSMVFLSDLGEME
jgi:hypothetical protein